MNLIITQILLYQFFLLCIYSKEITNPQSYYIEDQYSIEFSKYQITNVQTLHLDYNYFKQAYSSALTTTEGNVNCPDCSNLLGCTTLNRKLQFEQILEDDGQLASLLQQSNFIEFLNFKQLRKIFLITDQFQITQLNYIVDNQGNITNLYVQQNYLQKFANYLNPQHSSKSTLLTFVGNDQQTGYIITPFGGVRFNANQNINIDVPFQFFNLTEYELKIRPQLYRAYTWNIYVYIAVGNDGIDVYQINENDKSLQFIRNIEGNKFALDGQSNSADIRDICQDEAMQQLFALDYNEGIYIVDYSYSAVNPNVINNFFVPIKGGRRLSCFQNNVIVIVDTPVQYAVEIYINTTNKEYYITKYYTDDNEYLDIQMTNIFGIFVTDNTHQPVFHSIYNQPSDISQQLKPFNQQDLQKIEIVQFLNQDLDNIKLPTFVFGLDLQNLVIYYVKWIPPKVICTSSDGFKKNFTLHMTSSFCLDYNQQLRRSVFQQCHIQHTFQLNVKEKMMDMDAAQIRMIIGLSIGIGLFIIISCIACIYCYKKRKQNISELELKANELRQKKYQQMNEDESKQQSSGNEDKITGKNKKETQNVLIEMQ